MQKVKEKYNLDSQKDKPNFRTYRDFFWRVGLDPTKNRPTAKALIRRILAYKPIPNINNVVDSYNLASNKTEIALAAFDLDKLKGELILRNAVENEEFLGIGMDEHIKLRGFEVIISYEEKLVAIYPYRDSDNTKVESKTKSVLIITCGLPEIDLNDLECAKETVIK